MSDLLIMIEGRQIGRVHAERDGRLSLEYASEWRESAESYALSVNMPLSQLLYPQRAVTPYLWNLLPENPNVLQRWAQEYHVSAASPFKLLAHVGADVAGAAQFIPPDRQKEIQSAQRPTIEWISVDDLAQRLRQLRDDVSAMRRPADAGKMSLPGAQAKTAYYYDEKANRWGVPGGRAPTTHIIKPCVPGFSGLVENEHLCQDIASRLGMAAARSRVLTLDQSYIVIERYDRLPPAQGSSFVRRIHQEDLCQALGIMPGKKYQEEGGPGVTTIVTLLRRASSRPQEDVERFLQANMFNWLIAGTDAHAKNYSLLIGAGDEVRLAPLYDLSSQLPYADQIAQRVAMKIGDHYDIARIGIADWQKLSRDCAIDEQRLRAMLDDMGRALPDYISDAQKHALEDGLSRSVITSLAAQLIEHVKQRLRSLKMTMATRRAKHKVSRRH